MAKKQKEFRLHNKPSAFDNAVLSWVAPEAIRHERGRTWKIVMAALAIGLAVGGIVYDAWTFSVAIVAFVLVYYLVNLENPKDVEVKISDVGIKVGSRKYQYGLIKAFWIVYDPPHVKTLNIRVRNDISCDITIQLDGQSPGPVREFLLEKIPELEGQDEKLSDVLLRILKI